MSTPQQPEPPLVKFSAAETEFFAVSRIGRNGSSGLVVVAQVSPGLFDGPDRATLILTGDSTEQPLFFLNEGECVRRVEMEHGATLPLVIERRHIDFRSGDAERPPMEFGAALRRSFPGHAPAEAIMRLRLRIDPWPPEARVAAWNDTIDLDALPPQEETVSVGTVILQGMAANDDGLQCRQRLVALATGPGGRRMPPVRLRVMGGGHGEWCDTDLMIDAGLEGEHFEIGLLRETVRRLLRQEQPDEDRTCSLQLHVGFRCIVIDELGRPAPFHEEVREVLLRASHDGALAETVTMRLGQETRTGKLVPEGFAASFQAPLAAVWRKENETLFNFLSDSVLRIVVNEPARHVRLAISATLRQADGPEHSSPQRTFSSDGSSVEVPLIDLIPRSAFDQPGNRSGEWLGRAEGMLDVIRESTRQRHPITVTFVLGLARRTDGWAIAVDLGGADPAIRISRSDGSPGLDLPLALTRSTSKPDHPLALRDLGMLLQPPNSDPDGNVPGIGNGSDRLAERFRALGRRTAPDALLRQSGSDADAAAFRRIWLDGLADPALILVVPGGLGQSGRNAWRTAGLGFREAFACPGGGEVMLVPGILAAARTGIAGFLAETDNATTSGRHVFIALDIGAGMSEAAVIEADLTEGAIRGWTLHAHIALETGADDLDRLLARRIAALLEVARGRKAIADTFVIVPPALLGRDESGPGDPIDRAFTREFHVARARFIEQRAGSFRIKLGERRASAPGRWPVTLKRRLALQDFFIEGQQGAKLVLAGSDIVLDLPRAALVADEASGAAVRLLGEHLPRMAQTVADRLCGEDPEAAGPFVLLSGRGASWPSVYETIAATGGEMLASTPEEAMRAAAAKGALDLAREPSLLVDPQDLDELALLTMRNGRPVTIGYLPDSRTAAGEVILTLSGDYTLVRAAPGLDAERLEFFTGRLPAATGGLIGIRPWTYDSTRFPLRFSKKQKVVFRWERQDGGIVVRIRSQDIDGSLSWPSGERFGTDA